MKRAQSKGLLEVHLHNLRQWAVNEYGQVDDYQYGGGAGMVMMCEPLINAIEALSKERKYDEIIYLTPDGKTFDQKDANRLSLKENLAFFSVTLSRSKQTMRSIAIMVPRFTRQNSSNGSIFSSSLIVRGVRNIPISVKSFT